MVDGRRRVVGGLAGAVWVGMGRAVWVSHGGSVARLAGERVNGCVNVWFGFLGAGWAQQDGRSTLRPYKGGGVIRYCYMRFGG